MELAIWEDAQALQHNFHMLLFGGNQHFKQGRCERIVTKASWEQVCTRESVCRTKNRSKRASTKQHAQEGKCQGGWVGLGERNRVEEAYMPVETRERAMHVSSIILLLLQVSPPPILIYSGTVIIRTLRCLSERLTSGIKATYSRALSCAEARTGAVSGTFVSDTFSAKASGDESGYVDHSRRNCEAVQGA